MRVYFGVNTISFARDRVESSVPSANFYLPATNLSGLEISMSRRNSPVVQLAFECAVRNQVVYYRPSTGGTHDPLSRFVACFVSRVDLRFRDSCFRPTTLCRRAPCWKESRRCRHARRGKYVCPAQVRAALHGRISGDL